MIRHCSKSGFYKNRSVYSEPRGKPSGDLLRESAADISDLILCKSPLGDQVDLLGSGVEKEEGADLEGDGQAVHSEVRGDVLLRDLDANAVSFHKEGVFLDDSPSYLKHDRQPMLKQIQSLREFDDIRLIEKLIDVIIKRIKWM